MENMNVHVLNELLESCIRYPVGAAIAVQPVCTLLNA